MGPKLVLFKMLEILCKTLLDFLKGPNFLSSLYQWPGPQLSSMWTAYMIVLPTRKGFSSALEPHLFLHPIFQCLQSTHCAPAAIEMDGGTMKIVTETSGLRFEGWTWVSKQRIHGGSGGEDRVKQSWKRIHLLWKGVFSFPSTGWVRESSDTK